MYLPKPVYEAVPYLHLFVGTNAALGTTPVYGQLSGIILMVLSIYVLYMRLEYRRKWK